MRAESPGLVPHLSEPLTVLLTETLTYLLIHS